MSKEVVEVAKRQLKNADAIVTLNTGIRVRVCAVSASLVTESIAQIERPLVPTWPDPERGGREVENPNDPEYLRKLESYETEQGIVAIEAMAMFGVDLADGMPEDDLWEQKLRFLEKKGRIDLSEYDLSNSIEREFVYKKYIAISGPDMKLIQEASGAVSEEDLKSAEESFQGNEE